VQSLRLDSGDTGRLRRLAAASILCWVGAITAGRFLAYTYTRLTATENISAMLHGGLW